MASFGEFVVARTGMMASQMALNITGQNISNINSSGYTRRSLDQVSFLLNGSGLYRSGNTVSGGAGVMMTGISQLRDPYLDIRFRKEMSNVGSADSLLSGLEQIQGAINDVNKSGITTQFQDLLDKIGKLDANNVGTKEFDALIRSSADSLCQLLNQAAKKLEGVQENYQNKYDEEVKSVNTLLEKIRGINEQIRKADINGDQALELRDQRNLMLDELSQYMKIDITYGTEVLGTGVEIEKLTIRMADNNTGKPSYTLIDGQNSANITKNDDNSLTIEPLKDRAGNVIQSTEFDEDGNRLPLVPNGKIEEGMGYGSLESMRQILMGEGTYSQTNTSEAKGIPYYMKSLDSLAKTFAEAMNKVNTQDAKGNSFADKGIKGAGNLFEPNGDDKDAEITAANISITQHWRDGKVQIVASTEPDSGTTANDNISRFTALFNKDIEYAGADGTVVYKGNFEGFYSNMLAILGTDIKSTSALYDNYAVAADTLNNSRDAVSGVDLNDEGINMIQYQKAFAASCRMMTALDELMDKVINGMGVVGR